jgi:hypothetical protein
VVTDALFGLEGALSSLAVTGEITANGGIALGDNDKATFGASDDLEIYHDGSNSIIADVGTGHLKLLGNDLRINNADSSKSYFSATNGGSAIIYHNSAAKLTTTATGVEINGASSTTGAIASTAIDGTVVDRSGNTSRFVAGRSGGNFAALEMHVAGASGVTKRLSIDYDSTTKLFAPNGTSEHLVVSSAGKVGIGRSPRVMLDVAGEVAIAHDATYGLRFYNQPQNNWSSIGNNQTSSSANLVFKDASGEGMRLDGSGNLLVGKSDAALGTAGHTFGNDGYLYHTRSGDIMWLNRLGVHGTLVTFMSGGSTVGTISTNANSLPSDRNFKTNINDLTLGLDFVASLKPVTYNYKIDEAGDAVMAGLIAQDVEESLNSAGVAKNSMTMLQHKPLDDEKQSDYQMDYLKLVPVLINAIKEQQTTIEALTARIEALENK